MAKNATAAPKINLTGKAKQDYDRRVAAQTGDKPKRKIPTPEERVAKLEAELEAARQKVEAKTRVRISALQTRRDHLVEQVSERQDKIRAIDDQLRELGYDVDAPITLATGAGSPEPQNVVA